VIYVRNDGDIAQVGSFNKHSDSQSSTYKDPDHSGRGLRITL
jgi:hypothetical protein